MREDGISLLGGLERRQIGDGMALRLLSAFEVLEARREAEELCGGEGERALWANACLLARALERNGRRVFSDGGEVLKGLSVERIGALSQMWAEFCRAENPSPEDGERRVEGLKKDWSTRLMSACSGVCSRLLGPFPRRRGPGR